MGDIINLLNLILIFLVFVIVILIVVYLAIGYKNKMKKATDTNNNTSSKKETKEASEFQGNLSKESIYKFMDFDEIKDNMIVRKNRSQYVMVIQCQGVNYDLLAEEEKVAVEEGFVQFLNTLRFPIQLYVQTRSLNLRDIIEEYKGRVKGIEAEVEKIRRKIKEAQVKGNQAEVENLQFEERRKVNVLEYGADITEYIGRLSLNKNVLQQKTYVIVSYFTSEFGSVSNYSKEEIDNMCFSELYTRCQSIIRSLTTSEVTGRILNSEEVAELLYIAYNRDDSELLQLSKALDAEYDCLYNTGKDILEKKKQMLEDKIEEEAVNIVSESIVDADKERQKKAAQREDAIKKRAIEIAKEYKEQMDEELFEGTVEQIENKAVARKRKAVEEAAKPRTKKETKSRAV